MSDYYLPEIDVRLQIKEGERFYSEQPMDSPEAGIEVMKDVLRSVDREKLLVVNLDNVYRPLNFYMVSAGGIDSSIADARNIFKTAILSNAKYIMLFHNHPSGNVMPSKADIGMTKHIIALGNSLGIQLLDHIIVGGVTGETFSMRRNDIVNFDETFVLRDTTSSFVTEKNNMDVREQNTSYDKTLGLEGYITKQLNNLHSKYKNCGMLTDAILAWADGRHSFEQFDMLDENDIITQWVDFYVNKADSSFMVNKEEKWFDNQAVIRKIISHTKTRETLLTLSDLTDEFAWKELIDIQLHENRPPIMDPKYEEIYQKNVGIWKSFVEEAIQNRESLTNAIWNSKDIDSIFAGWICTTNPDYVGVTISERLFWKNGNSEERELAAQKIIEVDLPNYFSSFYEEPELMERRSVKRSF